MNKIPTPFRFIWALWFVLLCTATGSALALPARGLQLNNWCALQPAQASPPQQSRPYQAAGSACTVCHTSGSPSAGDLNARAVAVSTCTGTGTGTVCGVAVNPFCIATAPSNATITAPLAGTTVAQNASLTFTAGAATNPDGFPLSYNWNFSNGQPVALGQSVAVPMTIAGAVTATLRVLNSVGMLATGVTPTRAVTVTATANQMPVATISSPVANPTIAQGGTVNFQGSGTDPDNNTPLTYSWSFPGATPASSTAQNPGVVTYATAGTFTASFTVRDSLGLASSTVTRIVTVTPPANQAPVATISAPAANTTITQGATVNFQGSGTDPDNNTPLTYSWSFPGGTPASSAAQNPGVVTYSNTGTFTASLTVTDSLGLASTTVTRTITVNAVPNQAPVATISAPVANTTIVQGATVNFQGSGTDPDNNTPLTYSWSFPGGTPATSTAQNPGVVTYATAGTFTATFTVTDSKGLASAVVTRTITVTTPANQAPVATISSPAANTTITQGGTVSFQGSGTDPDNNTPLTYSWSLPGGTPASSTAQNPGAVTYATVGTFTATFTVTDSKGLASTAITRTITVNAASNQAPVATISAPAANTTITQGGTVSFQGSGTDPDNNTPLTFNWGFPGGSPSSSTAQNPGVVTYAAAGTFTATFTVTDSKGLASTAITRTITVNAAPNQAPIATIVAPAANVNVVPGGTVSYQGSGTDPDNNTPLTYGWSFPGGTPASSTAQNPGVVTYATAGTFTASLVVSDSKGLASAAVTRTVTVAAASAPVARIDDPTASSVTIRQGQTVEFQGTVIDSENNRPFSFRWNFGGGVPSTSTLEDPGKVRFNTPGTFTVTFTVTNARGAVSAAATRTINVTSTANQAPIATIAAPAANVTVVRGGTVSFQGTGSDPDNNTPLTYSWSFPGGTPASSTAQNPGAVSFNTVGVFTASFTVRDSLGLASAVVTRTVTVVAPQPPVGAITTPVDNVTIDQGQSVSFQGSGSDPDNNTPLTYSWSFPGGTPASSSAQNPGAVTFNTVGTFTATFTVTDSSGMSSTPVTRTVTVKVAKPVASIVSPAINVSVLPGGTVNFRSSGTGFSLPLTYSWTFPGGNPASSTVQNPGSVRFSTAGNYTATLTITDKAGLKSEPVTRVITVAKPNQSPSSIGQCTADNVED